jgi:GT2 family glycosyltransferase
VQSQGQIVVAYCSNGTLTRPFHSSLTGLYEFDARNRRLFHSEATIDGCFIDDNRNSLVEAFLGLNKEWYWSIDTDHRFEPIQIYALFESAEENNSLMTAAMVFFEVEGKGYTVNWFDARPDGRFRTMTDVKPASQVIGGCGMACVLIHRSVFEKIKERNGDAGPLYAGPTPSPRNPRPWFDRLIIDNDTAGYCRLGEDLSFCARARAAGVEIRGEGRVCIDHKRWQWENHQTYRERLKAIAWDRWQERKPDVRAIS